MLKRHQCTINLALNVLSINDENIPFLSEHELPDNMRHEQPSEAIASQAEPSNIEKKTENAKYEESVIKGLIDLGFSRTEAISALDATEGNAEMAANLLFQ